MIVLSSTWWWHVRVHRIIEWLNLEWSSGGCPAPLLKQGHLDLFAQEHVQMTSEYLQGWRLKTSLGKCTVTLTARMCFLVFKGNLLCLFVLITSDPVTGHRQKEPGSIFFEPPPSGICIHWWGLSEPSSSWTVPAVSAFPRRRDAPVPPSTLWSFAGLLGRSTSLFFQEAQNWTQHSQVWPRQCWVERSPSSTCWQYLA